MARIFSISYDPILLRTREMLLKTLGHSVTSVAGFEQAVELCDQEPQTFDLVVLGHSIPHKDKRALISRCRQIASCPVLVLTLINEPPVSGATRSIDPSDAQAFLGAVQELLRRKNASHVQ